ncbi:hypothetical protein [Primorskyibacter sp. 2E107]|uniref:hypothetical protein n=1 Tax=Primorskyibacter sp. 2E107 TaxID=3403458 RepID=UPI003AF4ED50
MPQEWRTKAEPDPATHVAPPSIIQIKISQMLDEQANKKGPEEDTDVEPATADAAPDESDPNADEPGAALPDAKRPPVPEARQEAQTGTELPGQNRAGAEAEAIKQTARNGYEEASTLARAAV